VGSQGFSEDFQLSDMTSKKTFFRKSFCGWWFRSLQTNLINNNILPKSIATPFLLHLGIPSGKPICSSVLLVLLVFVSLGELLWSKHLFCLSVCQPFISIGIPSGKPICSSVLLVLLVFVSLGELLWSKHLFCLSVCQPFISIGIPSGKPICSSLLLVLFPTHIVLVLSFQYPTQVS
jgi:hypothetical protein